MVLQKYVIDEVLDLVPNNKNVIGKSHVNFSL